MAILAACTSMSGDRITAARDELAGTGKLRLGIVGPANASSGAAATLSGTSRAAIELATDLAQTLGVPLELAPYPSTGQLTNAAASGAWDVAFLLVDPEREKLVAFGPALLLTEIACLVSATAEIRSIQELDRRGTRLAVIENTTTQRTLSSQLKEATLVPVKTAAEQYEAIRSGKANAAAATRRAMVTLSAKLPGAVVLPQNVHTTAVAIAVRKDRPAALAYVSEFLEKAKNSGAARRALDNSGLKDAVLAPSKAR
jgi:polar amino acid transport system substrate-binding protein